MIVLTRDRPPDPIKMQVIVGLVPARRATDYGRDMIAGLPPACEPPGGTIQVGSQVYLRTRAHLDRSRGWSSWGRRRQRSIANSRG
jgi:hypothetical protein